MSKRCYQNYANLVYTAMIARTTVTTTIAALLLLPAQADGASGNGPRPQTPIEHLVVIFQENHSFDSYFATYPVALNPPGQPRFHARSDTPSVNGLTPALIERNPNSSDPFRIDRAQSYTCDQD